jgi:hypothetical protein
MELETLAGMGFQQLCWPKMSPTWRDRDVMTAALGAQSSVVPMSIGFSKFQAYCFLALEQICKVVFFLPTLYQRRCPFLSIFWRQETVA